MSGKLLLRGIYGSVKGKEFFLELGQSLTLGRSRSCDISLGNDDIHKETIVREGPSADTHFRSVSRKHLRISFANPDELVLEDLSSNGTFLDGQRIEKAVLRDFATEVHILILGTREKFIIEWIPE